jgi:hypothetical protein
MVAAQGKKTQHSGEEDAESAEEQYESRSEFPRFALQPMRLRVESWCFAQIPAAQNGHFLSNISQNFAQTSMQV